jgi:site-specific DNA recombinase
MRVATYTRISTDEAHQPYSLEAQSDRLGTYIRSQEGWTLSKGYSDQMSGATLDRPGLQRALTEARAKRYDLLLVYRVDRLARSVRGLAQIVEELDEAGVAFRSATEPFETATPGGRMFVQMLGVFAEFERATIIDRVIAGMERKAATGAWPGGYRPFGYEPDRDSGFLKVKQDEAPILPLIFDLYVNKLLGAKAVANELNNRRYRTKEGKPWSGQSVLTVLNNRVYIGEIFFRGTHYKAPHPPLVEASVFSTAQEILAARGGNRSLRRSNSSNYLLTGLVVCQRCQKKFLGVSATGNMYKYPYYICFSRHRYGKQECDQDRLRGEELEQKVVDSVLSTLRRQDLFEEAINLSVSRLNARRPQLESELKALEKKITKTESGLERYFRAFESGSLREDQCTSRIQTLTLELTELKGRRDELADDLDAEQPKVPEMEDLTALRQEIESALQEGSLPRRKAVLQRFIEEVRVMDRTHITPVFRVGEVFAPLYGSVPPTGFEPVFPP